MKPTPVPKLKVMADPVLKGQHPYHDCRFIVTADAEVGRMMDGDNWYLEQGAVIAKMTDCECQHEAAHLFAAAPEYHDLLVEVTDLLPRINDDDPMVPALSEWLQKVKAALRSEHQNHQPQPCCGRNNKDCDCDPKGV